MSSHLGTMRGFTLLETLAASAVFALIVVLLFSIVQGVGETASHQARRIESTEDARVALDALGQDLGVLVRSIETTLLFKPGNETQNDVLRFLCFSRPDPSNAHGRMMVAEYRIESRPDTKTEKNIPMLVRGLSPVLWPQAGESIPADYDFASVLQRSSQSDSVIAGNVFRFEILWMTRDGSISRHPPSSTLLSNGFYQVNLAEVGALIVTVASLDEKTRRLVNDSEWNALQGAFPVLSDAIPQTDKSTADRWSSAIATIEPEMARRNVRMVERTLFVR